MRHPGQADAVADTFFLAVRVFLNDTGEPEPSVLYAAGKPVEYRSAPASGLLIARDLRLSGKAFSPGTVRLKALEVSLPVITALPYRVLYDVAVVGTVVLIIRILEDSV